MSLDGETGEIIENCFENLNFDLETGEFYGDEEFEYVQNQSKGRKIKFNVPKSYLKSSQPKKRRRKFYLTGKESCSLSSKKRQILLKEVK